MKRYSLLIGGLLGGFTALVTAALSGLANRFLGSPDIAFSIFDWMTRHLPGQLITIFISNMVSLITRLQLGPTAAVAKQIEQGTAVVLFVILGIVFGVILAALARRRPDDLPNRGVLGGLILFILMLILLVSLNYPAIPAAIGILWVGLLFIGWGWILARLIQYLGVPAADAPADPSRRQFLYLVGAGSFVILVSSAGIQLAPEKETIPTTGNSTTPGAEATANASTTSGPARSPSKQALEARFQPVAGTRPELTANADFYRIDINTIPPHVDGSAWKLDISGLVEHPLQLTLDQIRSRPAISQVVTLECISNEVGGDLTSTGLWTGTPLKDVMAEAGIQSGAKAIYIRAADGYYESVPVSDMADERTLLVYAMNGAPLPVEHGFPLRIYIPNRFGMKQPKWITSMEVMDHEEPGYWVDRGWSKEAIPPTTSVIDTVDTGGYDPQTGEVPVGGIAYAGARGISKVEVQVDNGPWTEAELRTPTLSPLSWVQWRYLWKSSIGEHVFRVRAYDGTGKLQVETPASPAPEGATGIDSTTAFIAAPPQNKDKAGE